MKRLWIGLALSIALVVIAAHQIAARLSFEQLRPAIERDLSEALGLDVELAGPLTIDLFPELQLEITDVRIANLPGRPSPHLLTIGRLALELRILPLFRRTFVIDALELHDSDLFIEPDEQGAWSLHPDLDELEEPPNTTPEDPIAFVIRELEVHDLEIYFDRFGEEDVTTVSLNELFVESDDPESPLSIEARGIFEGGDFEVEAETGSLAALFEPVEPVPLELRVQLPESSLEAKGILGHPRSLAGMELRFVAELADLASAFRNLDLALPSLGSVELSGVLVEEEGVIGIDELEGRSGRDGPIEIGVEGAVRDIVNLEGVDLTLRVLAPDADIFKELTFVSLPGVPLRAVVEMDDDDGSLGVEGEAEVVRSGSFELAVEGVFGDLRRLRELDVRVGFETEELDEVFSALTRELSWKLPELGPVEATGRLSLQDGHLGIEDIDARVGDPSTLWLQAKGSVGDLMAVRDVAIEARLEAESARNAAALIDREIPEIGRLAASMSLRDEDGSLGVENLKLEVGSSDRFHLMISGDFDDLLDLEEIVVDATLEARDLTVLGDLAELELPAVGPVAFRGELRGSATSLVSRGRLGLNRTVVEGELQAALPPGGRPVVDLRIGSPLVYLPDILQEPERLRNRLQESRSDRFDFGRWWRGEQSLSFDFLREFDAEVELDADRVLGHELLDLDAVRFSARLDDGHLIVDEIEAGYEEGRVEGRLEVDARSASPRVALGLEAFSVDLTRVMAQFQQDTEYAGRVDLSIDLETEGREAPEVLSNLQGTFATMLRDGALVSEYSRAFSFNVMRVSVPSFGTDPDGDAPVHCLLAVIPIEDGIAEMETLYLEGKRITITGRGRVDLPNNELAVRLTPQLHEPGLVSVAATVEVSGPIERPVIRALRRSMVTSAAGALVRNLFRPLTAAGRAIRSRDLDSEAEGETRCSLVAQRRLHELWNDEVDATGSVTDSQPEP